MSEPARNPIDTASQVAVIGASDDIATDADRALARELGTVLADRRLTCVVAGDDGVMGEAAHAARLAGGTVLAILPRGKRLKDPSVFDAVVDTGLNWVQFSDALLRSVRGAVAIGGGAGTLAELALAYLSDVRVVLLGADSRLARDYGNRPMDERDLSRFDLAPDAATAVSSLLRKSTDFASTARDLADKAHFGSYPFGTAADYRTAATGYRAANETREDIARFEDATGDHFYYDVGDYLRAASHYLRARTEVGASQPSFGAYLTAIALESIGMSLASAGEFALASSVSRRSAESYQDAIAVSPDEEHKLLLHSAAGLYGDASLYGAMAARERDDVDEARKLLAAARERYEEALTHHPPYGEAVSSSSFARAIAPVEKLESELRMFGHGQ